MLGDGTVKLFLNPCSEMNDVTPELKNFLTYLAERITADEYTRKVEEAVETAKRDPRLRVEYMSYYADQADHRAELEESHAKGFEEGREESREEGLLALVETLKPILPDFEAVYAAVIKNEVYAGCSREEIMKYYESAV